MKDRPNEILGDVQQVVIDTIEQKFAKESAVFVAEVIAYDRKTKEATCRYPDGTTRRVSISGQDDRFSKFIRAKSEGTITNASSRKLGTDQVLIINAGFPGHTLDKTLAVPLDIQTVSTPTPEELASQIMIDQMNGRDTSRGEDAFGTEMRRLDRSDDLDRAQRTIGPA
jgi:hypothetical protein